MEKEKQDKIIRNVNANTWRRFTGICKAKNVMVGDELSKILKKYADIEKENI